MVCYGIFWSGQFCRRLFHCLYVIGVYALLTKREVKSPGASSVFFTSFYFFHLIIFFFFLNFELFKDLDKGRGQHASGHLERTSLQSEVIISYYNNWQ